MKSITKFTTLKSLCLKTLGVIYFHEKRSECRILKYNNDIPEYSTEENFMNPNYKKEKTKQKKELCNNEVSNRNLSLYNQS